VKVEVRCCCAPSVLHGHIDLPGHLCNEGEVVNFLLSGPTPFERVQLEVAMFVPEPYRMDIQNLPRDPTAPIWERVNPYLCLKDNGVTLDQLKRIRGFEPAG
jgi:hypothetical protein